MFSIMNKTITITQGDSAEFDILIKNPGIEIHGRDALYKLRPGDQVILSVKPDRKDADYLFQIEGPHFKILPEHTINAKPTQKYFYDVELRFANGVGTHTVIDHSPFIIKKGVTDND